MTPKSYRCYCSSYACQGQIWQRRTIMKHRLADLARCDEFRGLGQQIPKALLESLEWGKRCFDQQYEVRGTTQTNRRIVPHRRRISRSDSEDDRMDDDDESERGSSSSSTSNVSFNEPRHLYSSSMPIRSSHSSASTSHTSQSYRSRMSSQSSTYSNPPFPHLHGPAQIASGTTSAYASHPYAVHPPPAPHMMAYGHPRMSLSMAPPSLPGSLLPLPLSSFRPSPPSLPTQIPTPSISPTLPLAANPVRSTAVTPETGHGLPLHTSGAPSQQQQPATVHDLLSTASPTIATTSAAASSSVDSTILSNQIASGLPSSTTPSPMSVSSKVALPSVSDLLKLPALPRPPSLSSHSASQPSTGPPTPSLSEADVAGLSHQQLLSNELYRSLVDCVWRVSQGRPV